MSVIYDFFEMLVNLFPDDPVLDLIRDFKSMPFLGYLNYFLPISFMVNATMIWVGLLTGYRVVKILVNFIVKFLK